MPIVIGMEDTDADGKSLRLPRLVVLGHLPPASPDPFVFSLAFVVGLGIRVLPIGSQRRSVAVGVFGVVKRRADADARGGEGACRR